mgnify:CR=1 FL=1
MNQGSNNNKLRLFIYGKNALEDIKYISKKLDLNLYEENKYNCKIYLTMDKESKYEYFIINGEINEQRNKTIALYLKEHIQNENMTKANEEIRKVISSHKEDVTNEALNKEISNILLKYRKFYDVIVIIIDNLLDEDTQKVFKFFQDFTKIKAQQPFIIFLTKQENNPDIKNLLKLVTNEYFDKRNISAYKFPTNEEEIEKINIHFLKCMNYYFEAGNNNIRNPSQTFNILICGKAGVGKSCFINQFLQDKVAKEGEGLLVTHEITNYVHPTYPIRIFDTPGFENDDTIQLVQKTIEKFKQDIRDSKNHLDLIIYFNNLSSRNFLAFEIKLLKHLLEQKKKMIFVMNDYIIHSKKERNKLMQIQKDSIIKIINTMKNNDKLDKEEILNNMVVINLKQSIYEDEDEDEVKIKIRQCFGMDELFTKIYDMLKNHKISLYEIDKAKNIKELMYNISKYELLSNIKNIEDIRINIKIYCSKLILSYAKYDCFVLFFRDKRRKELLKEINKRNKGNAISDIDSLLNRIENKVNDITDKEKYVNQFFKSIERFKGSFNIEGFDFDAYWYNQHTLLIGYNYLKELENDYDNSKILLRDICNTFNDAIEDFRKLSEEWKDTYKALKEHKSDKDWIQKFFIVEIPEAIF